MKTTKRNYLLPQAKELRKNMTPQERKLWYLFLRSYPVKIYKQRIIASFIVDFYCSAARLVIEIDGGQHYTVAGQGYDAERSAALKKYDLTILRFTNQEIDHQFPMVCQMIDQTIRARI